MSNNTIYVSFAELFKDELAKITDIVIPKIQRSYAQGRLDNHATRTREKFLNAIHESLAADKEMALDFVYGHNDEGKLIPLDGQQRLTTLFLLHWYAAMKENIPEEECDFLHRFRYETRYSARDFCAKFVDYNPFNDVAEGVSSISERIKDQAWFPAEWMHDGTVSSMLVMVDAIHKKFFDIDCLWEKLNKIKFYFQPLEQLKLTDEIYIKMNSRGKPLSDFENFKAELNKILHEIFPDNETDNNTNYKANEISLKIDTAWTDILWQNVNKGNNGSNIEPSDECSSTDDAFLCYFRFICDILCYRYEEIPTETDEFKLLERYFTGDKAEENIQVMTDFFDCWIDTPLTNNGKDIDDFFHSFVYTKEMYEKGKVKLNDWHPTNLFNDCIKGYLDAQRRRQYSLPKIVLLYAVVVYLQHQETILHEDFVRRFRIINNLVMNSDSELRNENMPAILKQVDSIIIAGKISDEIAIGENPKCPNFYSRQLEEEREKQMFIKEHPELEEELNKLEDHPLLYGQISIIGLAPDKYGFLFDRFEKLFDCDWDLVDCGLFAMDDYSQRNNWWCIQMGTSNRVFDSAWKNLFHQRNDTEYNKTKSVLRKLLFTLDNDISNKHLKEIIDNYLLLTEKQQRFNVWYYYVKYKSFRVGRYGKYEFYPDRPYHLVSLFAPERLSSNSQEVFLSAMNGKCRYVDQKNIYIDDYLVKNENNKISVIKNTDMGENEVESVVIPQVDGIDTEDRVKLGSILLAKYA